MDLTYRVRSALGCATGEEHHQIQKNKVYGDNRTFFRGRLISGPDVQTCAVTFLLVFAPSVVWHIEVAAFWGQRRVGIVFALVGALLQLTSLLSLLVTAFSDPGIIPRQKEYDETYEPRTETYRSRQGAERLQAQAEAQIQSHAQVCIQVPNHIFIFLQRHIHIHMPIQKHIHIQTHIYMYMYMNINIYKNLNMFIHKNRYKDKHIHTDVDTDRGIKTHIETEPRRCRDTQGADKIE